MGVLLECPGTRKRLAAFQSVQMDSGLVQQRFIDALLKRKANILRPLARIAPQPLNPEFIIDNRRGVEVQEQGTA
jgi:hypothetical protein